MTSPADWLLAHHHSILPGSYDELYTPSGQVREHWQYLAGALAALGPSEIDRRAEAVRRLVREHAVTYHVYGDVQGSARPWDLDPIPFLIGSAEWAAIESGLSQRAEVLDLLLKDIYGPRDLIKKGLLPAELVYTHGGFLRPCTSLPVPAGHALTLYAADLARAEDGSFRVLADRAQAPSGSGYALANRMVISRALPSLYRDSQVHRLALYFQGLRAALAGLAPVSDGEPRIGLLSPGPLNETYFEHSYLAGYLGYPLVQGSELTVSGDRVWLRSLEGFEPVDVILRRVDDHYCDPVELWGESRLGVPGLMEAIRRGRVAVANPLGSSVLENPGLNAYLPAIARYFLGQGLRMPAPETWWCGEPQACAHVLAHLDRLVIKATYRGFGSRPVFGPALSTEERRRWHERIQAHPYAYVGQAILQPSSSPTLVDSRLIGCQGVLRSFLVARPDGYAVMPGGLTRVVPDRGPCIISGQAGAIGKDTWVLASEPERGLSLWTAATRAAVSGPRTVLAAGAACNLYWFARYTERAEQGLRLLRTVIDVAGHSPASGDDGRSACAGALLVPLVHLCGTGGGTDGDPAARLASVVAEAFAPQRDGNLSFDLGMALRAAQTLRDRFEHDAWRVMHQIHGHLEALVERSREAPEGVRDEVDGLITTLAALAGLAGESMIHGQSWLFLELGRRLERALGLVDLLRAVPAREPAIEGLILEALLQATASEVTYRRRYRSLPELRAVLGLLLVEVAHPRALAFQLARLEEHLQTLPRDPGRRSAAARRLIQQATDAMGLAQATVLVHETGDALRTALETLLTTVGTSLMHCHEVVTRDYFADEPGPQLLLAGDPFA